MTLAMHDSTGVTFSLNMKLQSFQCNIWIIFLLLDPLPRSRWLVAVQFQKAASLLGIGVTSLKTLCREQGLMRWPYRKRKSEQQPISKKQKIQKSDM